MKSWFDRLLARLLGTSVVVLVSATSLPAAVLVVSNTNDSGVDSLRAHVAAAVPGDTIQFYIPPSDPGYSNGVFTITLTTGEIVINKDLTIENVSGQKIAISGGHASRILNIAAGTISISNLSFIDGTTIGLHGAGQAPGQPAWGGAILNQGTLFVSRCTFRGNTVVGGYGDGGVTTTEGGDAFGGAIANLNSLSLEACTLTENLARGGNGGGGYVTSGVAWSDRGGGGCGGAIYNGDEGVLSLTNCTITNNNSAGANALGVHGYYTVASPGSHAQGGGIANFGNLTMMHCTVANNASRGGYSTPGLFGPLDGGPASGGGLFNAPVAHAVSVIVNSILAPNDTIGGAGSDPPAGVGVATGPDVNGAVNSQGYNLFGRSDGFVGGVTSDQVGGTTDDTRLDPVLGPFGDYGGPTQTLPLLPGSPAIDGGISSEVTLDQRYFIRNNPPDIGAFEYQSIQPVRVANISTRLTVQNGDNAMIGGFIVSGTEPKSVLVRAIGPSLPLAGVLADPTIEIYGPSGEILGSNDNWQDGETTQEIIGTGLPPTSPLESAFLSTLNPGAYTVIVRGTNGGTGIGLFEVYDLAPVHSKLANVSTRGLVGTGDNVMIGGTIVVGTNPRLLFRGIGPSLAGLGVPGTLADPALELYDGNGQRISTNSNWRDDQEAEIMSTGLAPSNDLESAIVADLLPGAYTAILLGTDNTTGVAIVEVYTLN